MWKKSIVAAAACELDDITSGTLKDLRDRDSNGPIEIAIAIMIAVSD
jgi:hypothetical protein